MSPNGATGAADIVRTHAAAIAVCAFILAVLSGTVHFARWLFGSLADNSWGFVVATGCTFVLGSLLGYRDQRPEIRLPAKEVLRRALEWAGESLAFGSSWRRALNTGRLF